MEKRMELDEDELDWRENQRKYPPAVFGKWSDKLVFVVVGCSIVACFGTPVLFGIAAVLWASK